MTKEPAALTEVIVSKLRFTQDEIRRLDAMAIASNMTRAQLIRSLVLHVLDDDEQAHRVPS